jgi:hypothetical protein
METTQLVHIEQVSKYLSVLDSVTAQLMEPLMRKPRSQLGTKAQCCSKEPQSLDLNYSVQVCAPTHSTPFCPVIFGICGFPANVFIVYQKTVKVYSAVR